METLANLLADLGAYFYLILIGGIELIAAVILIGMLPRRTSKGKKKQGNSNDYEQILAQGLNREDVVACVMLRLKDQMPCYAAGNLEEMLGVTLENLQEDITCLFSHMVHPEDGRRYLRTYEKWDGQSELTGEFECLNGKFFRLFPSRCPNRDYDLFLVQDITDARKRETEYEERMQQVDAANQFKTSFLFRMSHEIRTPMNGIIGMLTLAEGKLQQEHPAMQYLEKADNLADQLLNLINDILDMSRIEAGKIELENRPFSLKAFKEKIYDMFAKTLESKGVHYAIYDNSLTVDWVVGDELRVSQVLVNFLSNAVKFTQTGEVTVTFQQMMLHEEQVDIMFRVHDTGIGMKPEFISRIFQPFEQEDASTTRRFGGTGLGMAISDQLVKLMNGQIVVESMPGQGSDFSVYLTFPIAAAPEKALEETPVRGELPKEEELPCRLLMAEDNEINAMIATEILQQKGAQIEVAENGQIAVERFASRPPYYYDLILMDIQMPVMDGRTAARTIRGMERADAAEIPIFALSADAFVEDIRLSEESGMNGHLSKPINFEELWNLIQETLKSRGKESV